MKSSSALVGRTRDLEIVAQRLENDDRIVTLLGPEGIGKTAIAYALRPNVFVELGGAASSEEIADRIAVACGAPEGDPCALLRERGEALVVLDDAPPALAATMPALLDAAPEAAFVVTARARLGVAGEVVHEIGPLDVENGDAVEVLVAAARRAAASYAPRPEDVPRLVAIARALEGVPLALGLAGARLPLVGAAALAREKRSPLEDASQRALDALDVPSRRALSGLTAFARDFTVTTAAPVLGVDLARTEAIVASLHARSMIRLVDPRSPPRFGCYRAVRAVAERADPEAVAAARERHAASLVDAAEQAAARAAHDIDAREWLADERHELLAIVERATTGDPDKRVSELALRAMIALSTVLLARGPLATVAALVSPLVERTRDSGADPRLSARATALRGAIRREKGDARAALKDLLGAESIARALGDELLSADIAVELGKTVLAAGETAAAREHFDRAVRAYASLGARPAEANATALLACASGIGGDLSTARAVAERACALAAADPFLRSSFFLVHARACAEARDHAAARASIDEALRLAVPQHDVRTDVDAHVLLGLVAHDAGDLATADAAFIVARDRAATHGLDADAAIARGSLGVVARERGHAANAYALLADARDVCRRSSRAAHAIVFGAHLAALDAGIGRTEAASLALATLTAEDDRELATAWPPPAKMVVAAQRGERVEERLHVRLLRRCAPAGNAPPDDDALVVGEGGAWFRPPHGTRVGLERRKNLALLLDRLAGAPGTSTDARSLFACAWPGERALASAAAHRVRVAVATLRKMGLRDLVVTTPDGYMLAADARLIRV